MANYYAFTKNGKPVLGSPIQGKKPRGGKSTPIYLGEDCKVSVISTFPGEGDSYGQVDSYRIGLNVSTDENQSSFYMRLGYVYTGSFLTKEKFLKSINEKFGKQLQFKFIEDELFITRSFVGTVSNPIVNFIHD